MKDLQNGGLPVAVPGTIELNIGRAICGELRTGDKASKITAMKQALLPVALAAGSAGGSKLTGEQIVNLYLDIAQADLC